MADLFTPPPKLVQQWYMEATGPLYEKEIATRAAQWGADQELEACCEWTQGYAECGDSLRAARRPPPPSAKEQLLQKLEHIRDVADKCQYTQNAIDDLRKALEALPE